MDRMIDGPRDASPGAKPPRAAYQSPRLDRLGLAAALTATVSNRGMMDGFMGRRTG